jgi:hypothetical protein
MKEFVTAALDATETDEQKAKGIPVNIDDRVYHFRKPGDGQIAMLMASTGRHSKQVDQISGVINFVTAILPEEDRNHLVDRLLDYDDPYGVADIQKVLEYLIGEWSGRPTEQPSGSGGSPKPDGQNSTLTTPASISSDSPTTVS